MDQNETTALVVYSDSPDIEFTLPGSEEAYTAAAADTVHPRRISPAAVLRRVICGFFIGCTLITAGICAGHIFSENPVSREDIPAFLLASLSAGEVHASPAAHYHCTAPAPSPDPPAAPVEYPQLPENDVRKEPSPLTLTNETPYNPDPDVLAENRVIPPLDELKAVYGNDAPFVLILSTHATESYSGHEAEGYRTSDDRENVIEVAGVIAETLKEAGIGVIHCRTRFDEEDFTLAYYNASLEIRAQLRDHPSLQYIIDVHRDSVQAADGSYLAMESDGLAQMMFVVGTDHGGYGHADWEENFGLAARLHNAMEASCPGIMRPVNLRSASFNQQYTKGSLILEIGSCAGSLENALKSAALFAEALRDEIIG